MSALRTGQTTRIYDILLAVLLAAPFVFLMVKLFGSTLNMYPKAECRDWISWPVKGLGHVLSSYNTAPTRAFSLLYSGFSGQTCGVNVTCLNAINVAPLAATLVFIFVIVQMLTRLFSASVIACLIFLVSRPALHGLTWQATILDKLACLWGLAVLLSIYFLIKKKPQGRKAVVFVNVALGLMIAAGLGSKEVFWPTIPAIGFLYIFIIIKDPSRVKDVVYFILPALVTLILTGLLLGDMMSGTVLSTHTVGGDVFTNALQLPSKFWYLFKVELWKGYSIISFALVSGLLGIFLSKSREAKGLLAAFMFVTVVNLFINASTTHNSSFYYIYPMAVISIFAGYGLGKIFALKTVGPILTTLLAGVMALWLLKPFNYNLDFMDEDISRSSQFQASLEEVFETPECYGENVKVVLNAGFWQGGVFVRGSWCSHERILLERSSQQCLGSSDAVEVFRYKKDSGLYPDRYVQFDNDLKFVGKNCK